MQFLRDKFKLSSKKLRMLRPLSLIFSFVSIAPAFAVSPVDTASQLIISVRDQKLMLVQNGGKVATYPVSTSMFGLGDAWGRMTTPLGYLAVEKKIGDNAPTGAVFHRSSIHWRSSAAQCSGPRPGDHAYHLVARPGSAKRACFSALHLYSWHAKGEDDRPASQLRMHSNEVERRCRTL